MGSEESDIDCNETIERLYHYLDGELTDDTSAARSVNISTSVRRVSEPSTSSPISGT